MRMRHAATAAALLLFTTAAQAADAEAERSEAGIRAVEAHWVRAFLTGDSAYLQTLLDDDYVSVNTKGIRRNKADIIALAQKMADSHTPLPTTPPTSAIAVRGDAAIVTDTAMGQTAVDVFRYEGGRWHAWYSQHTTVAAP